MNTEIKNRFTEAIIIEAGKYTSIREAVEKNKAGLSKANLSRADLPRTDLSGANLSGANLSGANLSGANLFGADLPRTDLSGANLSGANLSGANLSRADLSRADLSRANLSGANLSGADLYGANGEKLTFLKNSSILCIGPIGSRQVYMTAYNTDKGIYIKTGCYFDTIENFKIAVHEKHKDTKHAHDYMTAIAFIKAVMRI
jgi:uncharacterized protein YjbI with pentapeptide repeats